MKIRLLKSKMALYGDTQFDLTQALGITKAAMSVKMNGKNPFKLCEVKFIADRYKLTNDEIVEIFLKDEDC